MRKILENENVGPIEFWYYDDLWMIEKAMEFQSANPANPIASKCVGCVDGIEIKITEPSEEYGLSSTSIKKTFMPLYVKGCVMLNIDSLFLMQASKVQSTILLHLA